MQQAAGPRRACGDDADVSGLFGAGAAADGSDVGGDGSGSRGRREGSEPFDRDGADGTGGRRRAGEHGGYADAYNGEDEDEDDWAEAEDDGERGGGGGRAAAVARPRTRTTQTARTGMRTRAAGTLTETNS